ncbi:MAG: hypothetical protein VX835_00510, partial [Pseudomonadota bacterium]|nr:hypothetical protein [Pseudomonadota bacterium]
MLVNTKLNIDQQYMFFGCLVSLVFVCFFKLFGESWPTVVGDAEYYVNLYNYEDTIAPYGYRILIPYLAKFLPFGMTINFEIIQMISLCSLSGLILCYFNLDNRLSLKNNALLTILFVNTYPFVYSSTSHIRLDAPLLCIMMLFILFTKQNRNTFILIFTIFVGILIHEMFLFTIVLVLFDKILNTKITGSENLNSKQILILVVSSLLFYSLSRAYIPILASDYHVGPSMFFQFFVYHFSIYNKFGLILLSKIYATFGPLWLFLVSYLYINKCRNKILFVLFAGLILFALTFLAADTLRVTSIYYLIIILYSFQFLQLIKNKWVYYILILFQFFH